jgi:hypothetical protein
MLTVNQFKTYQLPSFSDPESQSVTLSTMRHMSTGMPSFMTYISDNRTYVINPRAASAIGQHKIAVILNDGMMSETFTFTVMITA